MDDKSIVRPDLAGKIHHPRSHSSNSVAKVISNMKMSNPIKKLVSQRRKRYTKDGFNLDLTYISENLIAMGYPAEKLEGVYRNHIDDVVRFLEEKHQNHYKIYNLCAERSYDITKFQDRVAHYPFDDHNPPCMEVIKPFCEDVDEWLSKDSKNVAVVHCKAGKGRTGVMVSCYMLHCKQFPSAEKALNYYGSQRTTDRKGVTIPSQRRYVNYYAMLVQEKLLYKPVKLFVREVRFEPVPLIFATTQGSVQFAISECKRVDEFALKVKRLHKSVIYDIKKGSLAFQQPLLTDVAVQGDVKIEFFKHSKLKKEKLFHFWFNTFFVRDILRPDSPGKHSNEQRNSFASENSCGKQAFGNSSTGCNSHNNKPRAHSVGEINHADNARLLIVRIPKYDLDKAHKDKQNKIFSSDFKVTLILEPVPKECNEHNLQTGVEDVTPSESSEAESSTASSVPEDEEEGWESG